MAPRWGALLFHGNHPAGSQQRAATVLRRALVSAGWVVLAIDRPGYGDSPCPDAGASLEAWDPLPAALAAFNWLQHADGVKGVVAIGRSLGCDDVARLLAAGRGPRGAILFGAGLPDGSEAEQYWYGRFHDSRRMEERTTLERFREIRDRYYDIGRFARGLDPGHPEIVLGFFGDEHANIAATRDRLHALLPGPTRIWRIDGTHYFSSYSLKGLIVGDTRVTRAVSRWLRAYREELDN